MNLPDHGDDRIWDYARIYTEAYDEAYRRAESIGMNRADCIRFAHDEATRIARQA